MYTLEKREHRGHPILGVILGLAGLAISPMFSYLTGVISGVVALILGLIALILGVKSRKGGRGVPAIITGALAILAAMVMTAMTTAAMQVIRDKAVESGRAPLVERYADKPYLGIMGLVLNATDDALEDEGVVAELRTQLDLVIGLIDEEAASAP